MRTIRRNVFETNSSSVHSVSISSNHVPDYDPWDEEKRLGGIVVDDDTNRVLCHFGEFGWEEVTYTTEMSKLSYLLTMVVETEGYKLKKVDDFYKLPGFKMLNEMIATHCRCDGIEIVDPMRIEVCDGNPYLMIDGYIDHQSCEYENLADFLNDYSLTALEFVFSEGVELTTGNDNVFDD